MQEKCEEEHLSLPTLCTYLLTLYFPQNSDCPDISLFACWVFSACYTGDLSSHPQLTFALVLHAVHNCDILQ